MLFNVVAMIKVARGLRHCTYRGRILGRNWSTRRVRIHVSGGVSVRVRSRQHRLVKRRRPTG